MDKTNTKNRINKGFLCEIPLSIRAVFAVAVFLFLFGSGFESAGAKTITIDGKFEDWEGVPKISSESLASYPYDSLTYYFNLQNDTWQTSDPGYSTCMFNENHALEVADLSIANDNNYLSMLLRRGGSFRKYFWLNGNEIEREDYLNEPAPAGNANPCAGRVITAPADFRHDMVLSFDKDRDGRFDYYLVCEITYEEGAFVDKSTNRTASGLFKLEVKIYQNSGESTYAGGENETLLATLETGEYDYSYATASSDGLLQEFQVDLEKFLDATGLEKNELYNVHYISHSQRDNVTPIGEYEIGKDKKITLSTKIPPQVTKSKFWVKGKTAKGSNLRILLDGEEYFSGKVGAAGRFQKRIPIEFGSKRVKVLVSHAAKGTNYFSKTVRRKATRAADKPLSLSGVGAKDKTDNSTILVHGTAQGVSQVQIFVNDFVWGWAVVKPKSGNYEMFVRLSEGLNTVKVTATKGDEQISVTKVIEKI